MERSCNTDRKDRIMIEHIFKKIHGQERSEFRQKGCTAKFSSSKTVISESLSTM